MKTITIILLLLPFFGRSQEQDSIIKVKKNAIGINYSLDRTFRVLKNSDAVNSQGVKESRDKREESSINYTVGLNFSYALTKRMNIEIGVLYAQTGYQTKEAALTFGNIQDPRRGFTIDANNLPLTANLTVDQNYLNIPVGIKVYLIDNKVKFFLEGDLSTNIYLSRKLTYRWTLTDGSQQFVSSDGSGGGTSKINMAFVLGFGVDYSFKNKYILRLNPIYRRSITKIADWVNKEYIYSYGINLGVFYKF